MYIVQSMNVSFNVVVGKKGDGSNATDRVNLGHIDKAIEEEKVIEAALDIGKSLAPLLQKDIQSIDLSKRVRIYGE